MFQLVEIPLRFITMRKMEDCWDRVDSGQGQWQQFRDIFRHLSEKDLIKHMEEKTMLNLKNVIDMVEVGMLITIYREETCAVMSGFVTKNS